MINDFTLSKLRDQMPTVLPDLAELYDPQHVADGEGGASTTWALAGTVRCRLDPIFYHTDLDAEFGQPTTQLNFLLTVPYDAPIRPHQLVVINGREYRIVTLADDHSWRVAKRAHLTRAV